MNPERKAQILANVGSWVMRALIATLRIRFEDPAGVCTLPEKRPIIWAFWHNRLFLIPYIFERHFRGQPGTALTSASKDGAILAAFIAKFGIGSIRGSSSRRGARALVELRRSVEAGVTIAMTPDGPRGPRYRLGPGIVKLAQITGTPITPVHVSYSRYWQLKSWDAFMIPKPFSKATVIFDVLHEVPPTQDDASFEKERLRLEDILRARTDA